VVLDTCRAEAILEVPQMAEESTRLIVFKASRKDETVRNLLIRGHRCTFGVDRSG
jgi:hypothetical protein